MFALSPWFPIVVSQRVVLSSPPHPAECRILNYKKPIQASKKKTVTHFSQTDTMKQLIRSTRLITSGSVINLEFKFVKLVGVCGGVSQGFFPEVWCVFLSVFKVLIGSDD